jgi:hypothetical protein
MKVNIPKSGTYFLVLLSFFAAWGIAQEPVFESEELMQILAPIALYPDSLLSQILMASTYPLEVVQAQRWVEQNGSLTGDALLAELEKQTWDPSVKSLVNFPQVLKMMNEKIDWTQKLGDAVLAQQKGVMEAIQSLRKKAQLAGSLKSTDQQAVTVQDGGNIIIEYANPQVVYVPTYDPATVYGTWPYPAYPPYYYYPPDYYAGAPWVYYSCGPAWGYSWGYCDWDDCDIDIDVDHDFGDNIDRGNYVEHYNKTGRLEDGKGKWKHNPENRKGVAYRDQATAKQFNRASTADAVKAREEFRGRADQGRQDLARGDVKASDLGRGENLQSGARPATRDVGSGSTANRGGALEGIDRGSTTRTPGSSGVSNRATGLDTINRGGGTTRPPITTRTPSTNSLSSRGGAMDGMNHGSSARNYSNRGATSRQSMSRPSGGMGGGARPGGMGGGARPGGGGGRPGGGRGGGGRR